MELKAATVMADPRSRCWWCRGTGFQAFQGALGDAGLLRQLGLAEVAAEALLGNAAPELLEQGIVGHQALKGHGTPAGQSSRMASPGILAEVLAITAELAWSSSAPKQPIPGLQHQPLGAVLKIGRAHV